MRPASRASLLAVATLLSTSLPAARAAGSDFAFVTIDPASGSLAPVPGGAAATPAALAPGNAVKATVTCDLAPVVVPVVRGITVGYVTVPSGPPAGRSLPTLVQAPAVCTPPKLPAAPAPSSVIVSFGFACPANAIAETQIARLRLTLHDTQWNPGPTRIVDAPANFVVKCPQPVAHLPFEPGLAVAPSAGAKATPPPTKKP